MGKNDGTAAVQSWLAQAQMRKVEDYVSRGREFEHTSEKDLAAAWVDLMRAWAASPKVEQDLRRIDIEVEYSLRGVKPPYELVRAELDTLARKAAELVRGMDQRHLERIDGAVSRLNSKDKGRKN